MNSPSFYLLSASFKPFFTPFTSSWERKKNQINNVKVQSFDNFRTTIKKENVKINSNKSPIKIKKSISYSSSSSSFKSPSINFIDLNQIQYEDFLNQSVEFRCSINSPQNGRISKYFTSDTNVLIGSEKTLRKLFKCRFCGILYDKGCALGGHISRVHKKIEKKKIK